MSNYLAVFSTLVSVVSLLLGLCAVLIARGSLTQSRDDAARERRDWRQRKWFDLYAKVDEAYDLLDLFQARYGSAPLSFESEEQVRDWNGLMCRIRAAHRMAVVFPKNPAADELFACAKFKDPAEALSKERLRKLFDAAESLRQQARIEPAILDADAGST